MTNDDELVLTRVFQAERERVFAAFVEPERLARWWGPTDFTTTVHEFEARPGGVIRVDMRGPDGTVYPMGGAFEEIVAPERLVFLTRAIDAQGAVDLEIRNTATFVALNGATQFTLRARVIRMTELGAMYRSGMAAGWAQSLEKLATEVGTGVPAP
jgi:uncharacterized protein YndB with AHSA1/START domain